MHPSPVSSSGLGCTEKPLFPGKPDSGHCSTRCQELLAWALPPPTPNATQSVRREGEEEDRGVFQLILSLLGAWEQGAGQAGASRCSTGRVPSGG